MSREGRKGGTGRTNTTGFRAGPVRERVELKCAHGAAETAWQEGCRPRKLSPFLLLGQVSRDGAAR